MEQIKHTLTTTKDNKQVIESKSNKGRPKQ